MNKRWFMNKMKEVKSFLKIMGGRATHDNDLRAKGAKEAVNAMDKEREEYLKEIKNAGQGRRMAKGSQERDISAI